MMFRIIASLIAVGLVLAYLLPVVIKLKEVPLTIVVVIGLGLMLYDLWSSLRKKED